MTRAELLEKIQRMEAALLEIPEAALSDRELLERDIYHLIRDQQKQIEMLVGALAMNQRIWEMSCDEPVDGEFICQTSRETARTLARINSDEWFMRRIYDTTV